MRLSVVLRRFVQKRFELSGFVLIAVGILVLQAPFASATETRMSTLQGIPGAQDEVEVYTYPSAASRYELALVELGTSGDKEVYGGALAKINGIHAGAFVSRNDWLFSESLIGTTASLFDRFESAATSSDAATPQLLKGPERPFELIGAMPMANGVFGVRLAYAAVNSSQKKEDLGVSSSAKQSGDHIQLGVGYTMGTIDLGFTIDPSFKQSRKDTAGGATTSTEAKGKLSVGLNGRWLQSADSSGLYGAGAIHTRTIDAKSSSAGASESSKFEDRVITVEGGYAALTRNKTANLFTGAVLTNVLSKGPTVTGIGEKMVPSYLTSDKRAEVKTTVVAGALSGEADVAGGVGAMMGLHYILFGSIAEDDDTTGKKIKTEKTFAETSDSALWSLGVYYKVDALRVDASYGKEFLHNGPFLVSGAATKPLLARISARYAF